MVYTRPKTVTHPGTNRARRALTSFMRRTPLTTTPRRQPPMRCGQCVRCGHRLTQGCYSPHESVLTNRLVIGLSVFARRTGALAGGRQREYPPAILLRTSGYSRQILVALRSLSLKWISFGYKTPPVRFSQAGGQSAHKARPPNLELALTPLHRCVQRQTRRRPRRVATPVAISRILHRARCWQCRPKRRR